MKLNLFDRALAGVDPVRVAARLRSRLQIAAYESMPDVSANAGSGYTSTSGQDSFLRRWRTTPRSAGADTLHQLPNQRGQSRDLSRNNPLAASAVNTAVMRAIGTGLACSPQPHLLTLGWSTAQAEEWVANTMAEFSLFADSRESDWYGDQTFYEQQALVLRGKLESGDGFTVLPDGERTGTMPYRLRIQTLEADRVGNPRGEADTAAVAGGIRRAATGGPAQAAFIYDQHPGAGWGTGKAWEGQWFEMVGRSGRRRVLHHFTKLRPEQPRGVPYLAPVMGLFKLLGDYTDAEVKAAVVSAFLTVFITTETGGTSAPIFGMGDPAAGQAVGAGQQQPSGPGRDEIALAPAAVVGLAKGESATTVNPGRPNPAFGDFVQAVLDQLGAGTFIGSEMLMKKFNTSYVAARAAFLDAWKWLLFERTAIALSFCQPVYETWMAEAVAIGRVRAPGFFADPRLRWAYTRAAWHGDSQGSINPKDEVKAYVDARDARLITNERAEWELFGTDWRSTYSTKLAEHQRMQRDGMLPTPKAGAAAPGAAPAEPQGDAE